MRRDIMEPILDTLPCGYAAVTDDGTMLEVNTTLATTLGYTRIELQGWHLQKILAPGGRIFYQTHVFPLLKLHGLAEEIYLPLRTRDGADVPMLMNTTRRERDGVAINDCVFVRMIQRHELEDQLVEARRTAERASAAKAKFLSMMSHDLRTPLTTISGYADLVDHGAQGPLTTDQHLAMQVIKQACGELLRLLNDILAFAQLDSGRVEVRLARVPVRSAVERAERLVHLALDESQLAFEIRGCDDDTAASADADRLQQILLNLLTNAIKFTPAGGRISVVCSADAEHVRLHVRDTGIGIPPDQLEHIFDPFVQLQQPRDLSARGVGLGLAISRELARAMGGELAADSRPGEGSEFTVTLPADAAVVLHSS
jgi:PAS domain S-box-containing protein